MKAVLWSASVYSHRPYISISVSVSIPVENPTSYDSMTHMSESRQRHNWG